MNSYKGKYKCRGKVIWGDGRRIGGEGSEWVLN